MSLIDFIIQLTKDSNISKSFIDELKNVTTKDALGKLLEKYKVVASEGEINTIFVNLGSILNMQKNPIEPQY